MILSKPSWITASMTQRRLLIAAAAATLSGGAVLYTAMRSSSKKTVKKQVSFESSSTRRKRKVGVNAQFFSQLRRLLTIVVPRFRSRETFQLSIQGVLLFARTLVSIAVARLDLAAIFNDAGHADR